MNDKRTIHGNQKQEHVMAQCAEMMAPILMTPVNKIRIFLNFWLAFANEKPAAVAFHGTLDETGQQLMNYAVGRGTSPFGKNSFSPSPYEQGLPFYTKKKDL